MNFDSIEVYRALTSQIHAQENEEQQQKQQAVVVQKQETKTEIKLKPIEKPPTITDVVTDDPAIDFFDNMVVNKSETFIRDESDDDEVEGELLQDLLRVEDIFIAHIIVKCLKLCPSAFEVDITKAEIMNLIKKASRFLWRTHVGGTLEHYVLWWSQLPLACRPVGCAKYLREWLLLIQAEDAPEPILSTLKGLGEILTVHVCGTTWDKHFRLCLVSASLKVDHCYENTEFYYPEDQVIQII